MTYVLMNDTPSAHFTRLASYILRAIGHFPTYERVKCYRITRKRANLDLKRLMTLDADDIRIAVATHKPYHMPQEPIYMPIQVGKSLHPDIDLGFAVDNMGDNISNLNDEFSELTAVYWLWKNCDAPYKGIVHYRRHFRNPRARDRDRFKKIATEGDFCNAFEHVDIVVPRKRNYYIETIYSHYAHTFPGEQLDELRQVLLDMEPDYVNAFDNLMQRKKAHMFNMFVMSREKFDEYCAWLFPILFELTKRIDPQKYNDAFQARYPGRVSERLLDVWINTNGYEYAELPVISPEPINWFKKAGSFLLAKLGAKKYTKSF